LVTDPRGLQLDWHRLTYQQLVDLLDDNRFAVRERATEQLRRSGAAAIDLLSSVFESATSADHATTNGRGSQGSSLRKRLGAVWTLCRMDQIEARTATRIALNDTSSDVRQAAVVSAGLHRDAAALPMLRKCLAEDEAPAVRREAANALGRIGDAQAVAKLLDTLRHSAKHAGDALPAASTAFLDHAAVLALIRIADARATRAGLVDANARVQRGALIALDQMPAGNLQVDDVVPLASSPDADLQRAAVTILIRHLDWDFAVAELLDRWLSQQALNEEIRQILTETLRAFHDAPAVQQRVERRLNNNAAVATPVLCDLLNAVAASGLEKPPTGWRHAIQQLVSHRDESVCLAALRAIETLKLDDAIDPVKRLIESDGVTTRTRIAAVRTAAILRQSISDDEMAVLVSQLEPEVPVPQRLAALEVVEAVRPDAQQLPRLTPFVSQAGPIEMPHLLRAFAGCRDADVGMALVDALNEPSIEVSAELLSETLQRYPDSVRERSAPLMDRLREASTRQAERLTELDASLSRMHGSVERGRELFFGKANCHLCHQVSNQGGKVGPDLTAIGDIRSQRDLLEAVLVPSASFARGYESISVILTDGQVLSGLVGRETPDELVLNGVRESKPIEIRVARDQIDELSLGRVSLMPDGLERQLTLQELSDLFAYLGGLHSPMSLGVAATARAN
jgi:putative heme-binding domain-containing protein